MCGATSYVGSSSMGSVTLPGDLGEEGRRDQGRDVVVRLRPRLERERLRRRGSEREKRVRRVGGALESLIGRAHHERAHPRLEAVRDG
jgi:hypothetical protein